MSTPIPQDRPFPGPLVAVALAGVAWGTFHIWFLIVAGHVGAIPALIFALAIGYGLVGILALSQVRRPRASSLGLVPLAPRYLLHVALLVPAIFVGLELQSVVRLIGGRAGGVGIYLWTRELVAPGTIWTTLAVILLVVIVAPVLTEWFFRGIVQQGVVARLGRFRGVALTAVLSALPHAGPRDDPWVWIAVLLSVSSWGFVAGVLRITTGSIVAPVLVHAGWSAVWLAMVLRAESAPVPALTAFGASLPMAIVLPSVLCVLAGAVLQWRAWKQP